MKNLRYGVPRIFSTTTRRLLESSSTACGNFLEEEGEGRRRDEATVGTDERLGEWRGKWDGDSDASEMDDTATEHITQHPSRNQKPGIFKSTLRLMRRKRCASVKAAFQWSRQKQRSSQCLQRRLVVVE